MSVVIEFAMAMYYVYGIWNILQVALVLASVAYSAYMMASQNDGAFKSDSLGRIQTIRSSVQPHRIIYGEVMTSGVLVYAQSHSRNPITLEEDGGPNTYISLLVAFCAHEVEEIKEVWLNDKLSTDASFVKHYPESPEEGYYYAPTEGSSEVTWTVTKPYAAAFDKSYVAVTKYLGTMAQVADPFLLSLSANPTNVISKYPETGLNDLSVTGTFSGLGMAVFTLTINTAGETDTFNWTQTKYEGDGITLTAAASGSAVAITGAAQLLAEGISVTFAAVTGHSVGQIWEIRTFDGAPWTADCTLTNRTYVVVTLTKDDQAFPTGLPTIKALIKGNNQIYDPRTEEIGYTNNWALCVRDYLTKKYGLLAPVDDINETVAIAAANICDESVTLVDETTQARYTCNGSFTVDKTPTAIMNEILATAFGAIAWIQGQYRILPAIYYTPDVTFYGINPAVLGLTESDLCGSIKVRPVSSIKDKFNTVKGTFISPETWQPIDFPKVTNATYVAQDAGKDVEDITTEDELVKDIQFGYITNAAQAQRVAKIILEKSRQSINVDFPAKWSAFPLAVGENVPITISLLGWNQKIFKVINWVMNPNGGIDLSLQEDTSGIYDWNDGEETTIDLASNTILPDPFEVPVPVLNVVGEELYATNVGSIISSRAFLTWNDLKVRQYEVSYTGPLDTVWVVLPITLDTTLTIDDIIPGSHTFRIRAMNYLGVWGDYGYRTQTLLGKTAPPPDVDSFLVAPQQDGTRSFSWTLLNPPLDIAGFEIRFKRGTDAVWETMSALYSGVLIASPYESNQLTAGDYVFAIKAIDTTGNYSLNAKYIETTLPDQRLANVWYSFVGSESNWSGSLGNCEIVNGILEARDFVTTWDTLGDTWDETTTWKPGAYTTFNYIIPDIDLGIELWFSPQVEVYGTGSFVVEMATSADGTTYTSWMPLEKIQSRYVRFRLTGTTTLPVIGQITEYLIYLVIKPLIEEITDLATNTLTGANRIGTGDIRLPLVNSYDIIKQVSVTLQNVGPGWSWELIDKDVTVGPRIKIYNGATLADCTIDAYIKGV